MRKSLKSFGFITLFTLVALGLLGSPAKAADMVTLKAVTAWPKTSTEYKAFAFFLESM
jgi:hypothetical protein